MAKLEVVELKFLVKLLGHEGYRSKVTELSPNSKTKPADRDRICRKLGNRELIEYDSRVARVSLSRRGKTLLELDTTSLPVTPDELKVLRACRQTKGSTVPETITGIPKYSCQGLTRSLAERGMLKINGEIIEEAWLSDQGKRFLLHEYEPTGSHVVVMSATMLGNYVRFLRENLTHPLFQS